MLLQEVVMEPKWKFYLCIIEFGHAASMIIGDKKFAVNDEVQISFGNSYCVPDKGGLPLGRYKITEYIESRPSEINGGKIKIHVFKGHRY